MRGSAGLAPASPDQCAGARVKAEDVIGAALAAVTVRPGDLPKRPAPSVRSGVLPKEFASDEPGVAAGTVGAGVAAA